MMAIVALAWASLVCFLSLLALSRALFARLRRGEAAPPPSSLLLVRPCAGAEPSLEAALRSSRRVAGLSARTTVLFAVQSKGDAAYETAARVCRELCEEGIDCRVIETHTATVNAKAGQLAVALERAPSEVLIVADSDVELGDDEAPSLLRKLAEPGVGAAWAPTVEVGPCQTLADQASGSLLGGSMHSFVLLAGLDPQGMVGKLFAMRTAVLEGVGGFGSLSDVLGEDMELARRLSASGLSPAAAPVVARSLARGRDARAIIERYARWVLVIRAQRTALLASYPLMFFPLPLLLAVAALGATTRPAVAALAAALALAGRVVQSVGARSLSGARARALPFHLVRDMMLPDVLLAVSFFKALGNRTVVWRGRALSISRGGLLRLVSSSVRAGMVLALVMTMAMATEALALPKAGEIPKNVKLEDANGVVTELKTFVGKPILIVYEDKDSSPQNQPFKDDLAALAKGDKYRTKVALAAVADLSAYNYWPVKGFVKDAIKDESKKFGTTIYCDWDGHVRLSYGFTKKKSSVVLISKEGKVLFSVEGAMSAAQRKEVIDLLRQQVEG